MVVSGTAWRRQSGAPEDAAEEVSAGSVHDAWAAMAGCSRGCWGWPWWDGSDDDRRPSAGVRGPPSCMHRQTRGGPTLVCMCMRVLQRLQKARAASLRQAVTAYYRLPTRDRTHQHAGKHEGVDRHATKRRNGSPDLCKVPDGCQARVCRMRQRHATKALWMFHLSAPRAR